MYACLRLFSQHVYIHVFILLFKMIIFPEKKIKLIHMKKCQNHYLTYLKFDVEILKFVKQI